MRGAAARTLTGAALVAAGTALVAGLWLLSTAAEPGSGAAGSAGCSQATPQPPGTSEAHTISSGGRERSYRLHLPDGYDGRRPLPVVLAFHGRGNTGAGMEEFSQLSTLPAIVAYPDGVAGWGERPSWQGAPYSAPGVDDVAFTRDLLDRLEATLCVATRQVYAAGMSNGAGFTAVLACQAADRIAAIAPVAGAFYYSTGEPCTPSRPVPVLEFHGTADATIPYTGDAERGMPAIPEWVAQWARRNGCPASPAAEVIEPDVTVTRWSGCTAEVGHVAVTDGGHTWPGADGRNGGGGVTTQTIEAHEMLWEFLSRHQLPAP